MANCGEVSNQGNVCQRIEFHEGAHMQFLPDIDAKWGEGSQANLCQWCAWPLYVLPNGKAYYCKKCDMIDRAGQTLAGL